MSRYGIDYYGAAYYGANTLVDFSAAPFIAIPYDYSTIQLTWTTPTGDWDYLRLIRNSSGFPIEADDGDILFEDTNANSRTLYIDNGQVPNNVGLKGGDNYYYSIFVRDSVSKVWKPAGIAIGISTKDYNTTTNMYNYLPTILTSQVPYDTSVEQDNDVLKRFLKLFALNLDVYKTQAENVHNRYDISNISGLFVPVFMKQLGLKYEPELGLKQSRIFLRNATRLYQTKGSKLGLEEFIKAYAGYDNSVSRGKNLMLDYNDSSFEESVGSWASISNATLLQIETNSDASVPAYYEVLSQSNFPNLQTGILKITAVGSANIEIALDGDTPRQYGIPVTSGSVYTTSAYTWADSTARNASMSISWYDSTGTFISASAFGTDVLNTVGSWSRVSVTGTAPSGAYYAVPHIKIKSLAATEKHYVDAVQFEEFASATYFQDARQIIIKLISSRINELLNPNFEDSTDNWNVDNATFTLVTAPEDLPQNEYVTSLSSGAAESYALAAGNVKIYSSPMSVLEANDYTFSVYVATAQTTVTHPLTPFIEWYDDTDTLIGTDEGDELTIENLFVRPYVTGSAPLGAVTAVVGVNWTASDINDEITIDSALFEKSSFVNSFFDGNHGVASLTDLFWEGDLANAARSHYYKNRFAVQSRLVSILPDWLTLGSTFELLFAQPD